MNKNNVWGLVFAGVAALSGLVYILRGDKSGTTVNNFAPLSSVNGAENIPSNLGYNEPLPNPVPANQATPVVIINGAGQNVEPTSSAVSQATQQPSNLTPVPWPVYQV